MKGSDDLRALFETISSVIPLAGILLFLQLIVFKQQLHNNLQFILGFIMTILGLHFFLKGVEISLIPLGDLVGGNFVRIEKKWIVMIIAFVIGYFATLVEPGLKALAGEVEELSMGAIPSKTLIRGVAIGFGLGMVVGVSKILYNISFVKIMLPLMIFIGILMFISPEPFNAIAFDAASATTGPVNIPINMAIAIGLATVMEGVDPLLSGFGIVGLTSMGSVISVMVLGIMTKI